MNIGIFYFPSKRKKSAVIDYFFAPRILFNSSIVRVESYIGVSLLPPYKELLN